MNNSDTEQHFNHWCHNRNTMGLMGVKCNGFKFTTTVTIFANCLANRKKKIMVSFRLFLNHFERITNSKGELRRKLCFTVHYKLWDLSYIDCVGNWASNEGFINEIG